MNEPITTIDPRYSDPNAVATSWEETRRVLETAELFWLATVRVGGRPHVTPVVGVWYDGALSFSTADTEQKAINLRGNPHVILTTGCNTWNTGLDVVVEGDAVRITDQGTLERLASVWATKWDGRWKHEVRDGYFYQASPPRNHGDSALAASRLESGSRDRDARPSERGPADPSGRVRSRGRLGIHKGGRGDGPQNPRREA